MGREGILYSAVNQAASELAAKGQNPTVDGVRELLGTGSKSTIAPMLKRWKAEREESIPESEAGLPAALVQALKHLVEKVQADARQEVETARAEHQIAMRALTERGRQLEDQSTHLAEMNAAMSTDLHQKNDAIDLLQAAHHRHELAIASLESDRAGLIQRLTDRSTEIASLNLQLTQARAQFERYQEAIGIQRDQERQDQARDLAAGRQQADERIANIQSMLNDVQQRLQSQQLVTVQMEAQLANANADNARLTETCRSALAARELLQVESDRLSQRVALLTAANDNLNVKADATEQGWIQTRIALAAQEREVQLYLERLAAADTKIGSLENERLELMAERAQLQASIRG